MKFSEKWLREWVNPPVSTETLVEQLTGLGLEVDGVVSAGGEFTKVVVAELLSVERHPEAERLSLCTVSTGEGEPATVVCGAPNVFAGMRAPLALPGARLPGGVKIRKSKIRGQVSNGMLCSARELELSDDADGIISLPDDAPVGLALAEYLALDDVSLDIDLTPNRGDCLGVAGIAREVGVANRCPVTSPLGGAVAAQIDDELPIRLDSPADCPRYVGRIVRGIDPTATTPLWMVERLRRSDVRAISPVVDVTNYVMLELGQPMHAFDLDRIDRGIRVRRAHAGEPLELLDATTVELHESTLVIADESKPVALAGIMGGLASSVTEHTRNILLESAWFEPRNIRVESRRYGMHTDASHRFERGVDTESQRPAVERATELLLAIVGGEAGPTLEGVNPDAVPAPAQIRLRASRVERLLGTAVAGEVVEETLTRLGMTVVSVGPAASDAGAEWQVQVPSFRSDVTMEADLIEEIARIIGYDAIPGRSPAAVLDMRPRPEHDINLATLRAELMARGYAEAITYSFTDPSLQTELDPGVPAIALSNPISSELSVMRTSLWAGLFNALLYNVNRQQSRVRLFETGLVFHSDDAAPGKVRQDPVIGGLLYGPAEPAQWGLPVRASDFFDLKGDLEALIELGSPGDGSGRNWEFRPAEHPALHPGQTARVYCNDEAAGWAGALHPRIQRRHKLAQPAYVFQVSLAALTSGRLPRFQSLSRFPAVRRDIAIVVDEEISAQAIRDCIGQTGVDDLHYLELFDVYRGEGIDSGRKSVALGLTFQDASRTLRDEDVERHVDEILATLERTLQARLR